MHQLHDLFDGHKKERKKRKKKGFPQPKEENKLELVFTCLLFLVVLLPSSFFIQTSDSRFSCHFLTFVSMDLWRLMQKQKH